MSVVEVNAPGLLDLVEADAELECIGSGFTFTEGPLWTNRDGGSLLFSDMPGDTRRRWSEAGGVEVVAHPSNKGNGLSWDLEGRLLICEHSTSSLIRVEPDGSRTVLASHWQGKELNSPNDVVVASDGSIVFTDPPYGRWPGFGVEREQELDFLRRLPRHARRRAVSCSSTTSRSPTGCASRRTRRRSGSTTPTAGTSAASRSPPTAR